MSTKIPTFSVFDDNPFFEEMLEYVSSPEGILREQVRDMTWEMLSDVQVDTANRQLLWDSADSALTPRQSANRINETVVPGQGVTVELIEEEIYGWLEMGYVPKDYTEQQMEELELAVAAWVADFEKSRAQQSA